METQTETPTYARAANGETRPSTPEEAAALAEMENAAAADAAGAENPKFGDIHLLEMTGPQMLELQHEMVATAVDLGMNGSDIVNRKVWRNKADGVKTCLALHKRILEARSGKPAPAPLSPGLRRLRASKGAEEMRKNTLAEGNAALAQAASARVTSEGGVAKETGMKTAASEAPRKRGRPAKKAAGGAKPRKAAGRKTERAPRAPRAAGVGTPSRVGVPGAKVLGARTEGLMEGTIHVLVEGNPKREGTKQHDFWKYYRNGMKVKTFIDKFSEEDGGRTEAMNRLLFDQKRALVKIEL